MINTTSHINTSSKTTLLLYSCCWHNMEKVYQEKLLVNVVTENSDAYKLTVSCQSKTLSLTQNRASSQLVVLGLRTRELVDFCQPMTTFLCVDWNQQQSSTDG